MAEGSNALHRAGRRLGRTVLCLGFLVAPALPATAGVRTVNDRIDRAPVERRFTSPSKQFVLVVAAVDGWKKPIAAATLSDAKGHVRWRVTLPHEGGPRAVLVNDKGAVLFIDEWINVIPRHALMVVGNGGIILGDHEGEAVLSMLKVPRRTIGDLARVGPWRSSDAVLSGDGQSASLRSGGRTVIVSLVSGAVRVAN
jgi:hypothetical protein